MELKILSPTAILGYGYPLDSLERGVREHPDVIAVDAGSTDPGPYYLGSGSPLVPDYAVERDLYYLIKHSVNLDIPVIVGSAGGSGSKPQVDRALAIVRRIAGKLGIKLRVGVLYSDIDKSDLKVRLRKGYKILPAGGFARGLTSENIDASTHIVVQNGVEPLISLLDEEPNVIIAGRTVDVAPFAALPWKKRMDKGLAIHLGKILECGAIAAEPGSGSDGMMGILRRSEFEVYPLNPRRKATLVSVAEHALYERTDPFKEYLPGGYADLSQARYEEAGDGRVIVKGTRWVEYNERFVKLEGSGFAGYRYIVIAGVRDPGFISRLNSLLEKALKTVVNLLGTRNFKVYPRVYGRNGVMGEREPSSKPCHEHGLLLEVVSPDKDTAKNATALLRSTLLHIGWEGRMTTAGNLAFPFSPSDIYGGEAYVWTIWHLIEEKTPGEYAKATLIKVG